MIKTFLDTLAYRMRNENDLSDFIWAACASSEWFKSFVLNFFFPNRFTSDEIRNIEIEREKSVDVGRPDFYFQDKNGLTYYIENKIGDENHHFDQYTKKSPSKEEREAGFTDPDKLGYIANYEISEEGYVTHTWEEFYDSLHNELKTIDGSEEKSFIEGICAYIQNVCCIFKATKPMDLDAIQSLINFNSIIRKTIYQENSDFSTREKNYYCDYSSIGMSFKLFFKGIDFCETWGIYLADQYGISIYFKKVSWATQLYNVLKPRIEAKKVDRIEADDEYLFLYMDSAKYKQLCNPVGDNDEEKEKYQEKILNDFFVEGITLFCKELKNALNENKVLSV